MRSLRCQLATTRVVQPKPSLASVDHTGKTNPVTPPNYGEYMDSSAGRNVELSGPLAAERRVLLDAALRQAELAMNNCSGFSREDLADHSLALTSSVERASVVSARFAAVAEERACGLTKGQPSMTAALNSEAGISRRRASQLDLAGSAPARYRLFYDALLIGEITGGHIEVLHPVWKAVDRTQFAAAEQRLVDLAVMCTPEEFRDYLAEWRNHVDEDAALDNYIRNQAEQHFQYGFDLFGNVHYSGTVGPEHAEPFIETVETEAKNHKTEDNKLSHAKGDAIVELLLNPDGKYRAHLEVLVPEHHNCGCDQTEAEVADAKATSETNSPVRDTAEQITTRMWAQLQAHRARKQAEDDHRKSIARALQIRDPHDLGFSTIYWPRTARGTLIPPASVQRMKTNGARIRTHVVDADGNIVDDRSAGRHFGEVQKRLIRLRDNRCLHSGCRRIAQSCEYDHVEPAEHGGPTLIRNGQLLCKLHHRWKHRQDRGPNRPTIFDDRPLEVLLE